MAMKPDKSKVHDRVEWRFVKEMMRELDFKYRTCYLIFRCFSSVSCLFRYYIMAFPLGVLLRQEAFARGTLSPLFYSWFVIKVFLLFYKMHWTRSLSMEDMSPLFLTFSLQMILWCSQELVKVIQMPLWIFLWPLNLFRGKKQFGKNRRSPSVGMFGTNLLNTLLLKLNF